MAETVDTRVVEARFDSKQFEQGVDRTVSKLDELKKSLNLKTSEKSIADIGSKIEESMTSASNSLDKLQDRFTSFFGMLKQKIIGGIADEIVSGIFRIKNSIEGLVSSLSTGQIGYGMQRYTDMLTSVRTLVSSGVNQDAAYTTIERLGEYADQTSYSLDQLVSTMSKFKTAGASLSTAQRMVEGLSNAAASMGVNAQDAARAYLNLQQAYSKGKMTQADWISFESLPMVGEKFNQAILDAAEKVGTLTKDKNGTYKAVASAIKEAGGKVSGAAAKGITAENMGSKLASGWFNKQVMEEVFGGTYYFAEVGVDEVNEIKAKEREIKQSLKTEIANGALAESKYDEELTNRLQKYFDEQNKDKIETKKKEIEQRKETARLELEAKKDNKKEYEQAKKEYDDMIKSLDQEMKDFEANNHLSAFAYQAFRAGQEARSFNDVLNTLKDTISRGWATSFELIFGKLDEAAEFFTKLTESNLANAIYAIGEFRNNVLEQWNKAGGRDNMIDSLEKIDGLLGSIFQRIGLIGKENKYNEQEYQKILEEQGEYAAKQYKDWATNQEDNSLEIMAQNLGDRLAIFTYRVGEFINQIRDWFEEIGPDNKSRIDRIAEAFDLLGIAARGVGTALGQAMEFIGQISQPLTQVFDKLLLIIKKIEKPIEDLLNPKVTDASGQNVYTNFQRILGDLKTTIESLIGKEGEEGPLLRIAGAIGDLIAFILELGASSVAGTLEMYTEMFATLVDYLFGGNGDKKTGDNVLDKIATGVEKLVSICKEGLTAVSDFFGALINDLFELFGIGDQTGNQNGSFFDHIANWFNTNEFIQKVGTWFDKAVHDVEEFVLDFPNRISEIGVNVGDFFKSIFFEKRTSSIANTDQTTTVWVKRDFTIWAENNILNPIKTFIADFPNWISDVGIKVGDFFKSIFFEKRTSSIANTDKKTTVWVKRDFTVWIEKNIIDPVKGFIKNFPGNVKNIGIKIGDFFKGIFYYKTSVANGGVTWVKKPFTQWVDEHLITPLKEFINDLPTYIGQGIGTVVNFVGKVISAIFGKSDGTKATASDVEEELKEPFLGVNVSNIIAAIQDIGKKIINGIVGVFSGSTEWDTNKNWLADKVGGFIEGIDNKIKEIWPTVEDWFEKLPETVKGWFEDGEKEAGEQGSIGKAVSGFVETLKTQISSIPSMLLNAWKGAEVLVGGLWSKILGWITGTDADRKLNKKFQEMYDGYVKASGSYTTKEQQGAVYESYLQQQWREDNPAAANIQDFFIQLGDYLKEKLEGFPGTVEAAWNAFMDWVQKLPDQIAEWFNGNATQAEDDTGTVGSAISTFAQNVANLVSKLPDDILKLVETAESMGSALWDGVIGWLIGSGSDGSDRKLNKKFQDMYDGYLKTADIWTTKEQKNAVYESYLHQQWREDNPAAANIEDFFTHLINYFKGKVEHFPDDLANAWTTIKEIGAKVGPKILEGLNTAFDWINTKLTSATSFLGGLHDQGKNLSDIIFGDAKDVDENGVTNPVFESIKKIGQTIYTMLTDTIPKFIGAAATDIWNMVPDIISGFMGGGKEQEEAITKAGTQAGEVMSNAFGQALNYAVDETFDQSEYDRLKNEDKSGYAAQQYLNAHKVAIENVNDFLDEMNYMMSNIGPESESPELASKFQYYVVDRDKYLKELTDESDKLTKELNELLESEDASEETIQDYQNRIQGLAHKITDLANSTEETFDTSVWLEGKENIVEREKEIESLNAELADITTKLEGGAPITSEERTRLNARQALIQKMLDALGGSEGKFYNMAADFDDTKTKKTKKAFENAGSIGDYIGILFQQFTDGFDNIKDDKLLKIGIVLGGLGILLFSLSKFLDNAMTLDDIGYSAKWVGIGTLMTGITILIGYMVALASQGDELTQEESMQGKKSKLERVHEELDYFKQFLLDIMEPLKWIMCFSMVSSIADMLATFSKTKSSLNKGTQEAAEVSNFFKDNPFGQIIGNFFGSFASTAGTAGGLGVGIEMFTSSFDSSFRHIGSAMVQLGVALEETTTFLGPSIDNMVELGGKIKKAIEALGDIKNLIEELNKMFTEITEEEKNGYWDKGATAVNQGLVKQVKEGTEVQQFQENVIDRLEYLSGIANIMGMISGALQKIKDIDDVQGEMKRFNEIFVSEDGKDNPVVEFFTKLDAAFFEGFAYLLNDPNVGEWVAGGATLRDLSAYFEFLGSVLSIFSSNFGVITTDNVTAMTQMFDKIKELSDEIAASKSSGQSGLSIFLEGDKSLVGFGTQLSGFGRNIKNFFDKVKEIKLGDETVLAEYQTKLDLIFDVIRGLRFSLQDAVLQDMATSINELGTLFTGLTENFGMFDTFLTIFKSHNYEQEELNKVATFFDAFAKLFNAGAYAGSINVWTGVETLADATLLDNLQAVLDKSAEAYTGFLDKIDENKFVELWKSLGISIGEESNFEPKITPVLELTEFEKEAQRMWSMLGVTIGEDGELIQPNLSIDMDGLEIPKPIDYTSTLNEIKTDVSGIRLHANSIRSSIGNVGFYVDGEELANLITPFVNRNLGGILAITDSRNNYNGP